MKSGRRTLVRMHEGSRSDAELIDAFLRRERSAADELYQAEDLVQDTFVKVWRKAGSYEASRGSLDTWVLLIARSLAIDLIRRRVLEVRVMASQEDPAEASDEPGPERYAETRDLADRARRAMDRLSPPQRAALELAYFGGKTSSEVAELEGIPVGTAKTRIRSALIRLREVLEVDRDEV